MYSTSTSEILHGYSVVRVSLDDDRDDTVPVGVVAWDTGNAWYRWRWLEKDEKVRGVDGATRKLMRIAKNQIRRWADARKVPYEPAPVEPTRARFWRAVSEILSTAVRLDPPKAMDPMDEPEAEIESLFEAVVRPTLSRRHHSGRTAMNERHHHRRDLARDWARSLKPGTRFDSTDADMELLHVFRTHQLLSAHFTGFESRPYLDQLTQEGIIERTGSDEWESVARPSG